MSLICQFIPLIIINKIRLNITLNWTKWRWKPRFPETEKRKGFLQNRAFKGTRPHITQILPPSKAKNKINVHKQRGKLGNTHSNLGIEAASAAGRVYDVYRIYSQGDVLMYLESASTRVYIKIYPGAMLVRELWTSIPQLQPPQLRPEVFQMHETGPPPPARWYWFRMFMNSGRKTALPVQLENYTSFAHEPNIIKERFPPYI